MPAHTNDAAQPSRTLLKVAGVGIVVVVTTFALKLLYTNAVYSIPIVSDCKSGKGCSQ
jgi:hypothetical protein